MKRHNFYKGELVTPTELNNLQSYTDTITEQVVNRGALGTGVIGGFVVTKENDLNLSIEAGNAYNTIGELLTLADTALVSVNDFLPTSGSKKILMSIKKDYIETDPIQDTTGNIINTTWTPTVSFAISDVDQGIPNGFFELAIITLNSQGIVDIEQISPSVPLKADPDHIDLVTKSLHWNGQSIIDIMANLAYPIGYQYTQYPNNLGIFELAEEPSHLFGGVWELLHSDKAVFFRTEGNIAKENRTNGIQGDTMQRLTGEFGSDDSLFGNGVFSFRNGGTGPYGTGAGGIVNFDNSRQARTSTENRPINMLMRIWKRIA
ncbi:MAG: hypothetical protein ACRCV0_06525 [Brevinema sp.]